MAISAFDQQIQNRNFLQPTGFKFTLNRSPKTSFFCQSANIPGMTLGVAAQPTYLRDIPTPGDKIEFEDLNLRFLVDENLENYMEIYTWIRGLGFQSRQKYTRPNARKYQDKGRAAREIRGMDIYSDEPMFLTALKT